MTRYGLVILNSLDLFPNGGSVVRVLIAQDFNRVAVEDETTAGAVGSHTLKQEGTRFMIETDAVSLSSVFHVIVGTVGKDLQGRTSEKTYI